MTKNIERKFNLGDWIGLLEEDGPKKYVKITEENIDLWNNDKTFISKVVDKKEVKDYCLSEIKDSKIKVRLYEIKINKFESLIFKYQELLKILA